MSKRNVIILSVVLVLVAAVVLGKSILQQPAAPSPEDEGTRFKEQYEQLSESGLPALVAFSHDAECCPSSKEFYDDYNERVNAIAAELEGRVSFLFVNVAVLSDEDYEYVVEIAREAGFTHLPALAFLDKNGSIYEVLEGELAEEKVREIVAELEQQ